MTQHTQPVVAAQHQQQQTLTTQHQQQQQTTTTPNSINNNNQSNNNNVSSASTTTSTPSTSNNQTQTVAVQQQQHQNNNNNNNNYQTQQNVSGPVYNPQLQPANVFVPAHNIPAHHHPQHHHQPGAMYQTMIPAALPSNVYVNNVTANVNLHGWAHSVPHSAWVHPGSAQHYIHGELPPEQGAPVMQPMTAMPVTLPNPNALTGPLMNHNVNAMSGGSRGSRRGRGRVGSSGSRRSDYNAAQRHPPPEGSPVPQSAGQSGQQDLQQQQQSSDSQQMMTAVPQSYVPHPQYAAQYPYSYPAFFAPPQHMLHPGQSAAAQQATGTPLYFPTMPVYNGHQMLNYGYIPVLNQAEYQYVPGEEVGVGLPVGDERQAGSETGAMIWHQQPIYTDEYGNMSSADMHAISSDDINHTSSSMGSAAETPNLLSPNYAPIYDPQMQEQMTQQMGVMQIYDDPQMGQIQVMHPQTAVPQIEDDLSECGSQPSSQIQMVAPIQLVPSSATQMSLTSANTEQIMHHQAPHLISATGAAAIIPTESNIASNTTPIQQHQIQQQQSITEDNTIDNSGHVQSYENVTANIQPRESVTSSNNEELEQKPAENLAQQDYHKQQQQQHQHQQQQQMQIQTQNVVVEAIQTDNYNSNRTIITEVQEVVVQEHKALTKTDVAIETVLASSQTNIGKPQQQQQQQQQQTVYTHQAQEKQHKHQQHHQQQQYGAKQQYQHQQLQTQSVAPQQQATNQHQQQQAHQQQQGGHYQQHQQQQHHQQTSYENRKSSQMYNQQQQSRRKYDYHHGHSSTGSNSSNNDSSSNTQQQHHQQQQTTKTMSWTNSSQHKKSTNTVAVTATPTSSHTGSGSYNKSSSSGATNSASTHTHTTRTYTNQQHHNYQQQQQNQQQQQQQQNYHYQQQQHQPQTRNYGAMKMPSSPIASVTNPMERKASQTSEAGGKSHAQQHQQHQQQQTTSTASTTAVPHQFQQQQQPLQHQQSQQTSTADVVLQHTQSSSISSTSSIVANTAAAAVPATTTTNISKSQQQQQYPPGFANKKHSLSNQGHTTSGNTANAANLPTAANTTETATTTTAPAINLAPPVTATTPAVPSTPSWASLFSSNTSNSNNSTTASANTSANILSSNASTASYAKKPVAKVAPYEVLAPVTPTAPLVTPGALSYSAASAQNLPPPSSSTSSATAAKKASSNSSMGDQQTLSQRNSMANLDEFSLKFAEFLTKYKSDWATISLRPRGLTNRSNYCYINSILQALLGCSPLYNLIRSIPKQAANLCEVKTPTINAMITFMSNFSNLPSGLRLRNPKGSKNNKDDLGSDLQCDPAFEPTEIYKLWNDSREEHVEGRQEDAEEFLSYILNKLNDEMLEVIKLIAKPTPEQNGQNEPPEEEGDAWQMICNNRNKGSVTRQTDFGCTPLSDIFRGELRSRLQREGELSTDVIQPFFTLQLNIEKAASVKEALEILVGRDQLEGVTGSKSKQEVVAWQQMNLEKLPPILILHLKWFDYRSDGCTKILKKVDFPVELKIDAKILASKKYSQKQRAYRLFAVVYHDGKEATKGHYITDVYHTGYGSWLRYDDSSVKPVSENHVLLPRAPRVPYLLCYRRCDTIPQQSNNNQNSSGGNNNNNNSSGNTTQSSGK